MNKQTAMYGGGSVCVGERGGVQRDKVCRLSSPGLAVDDRWSFICSVYVDLPSVPPYAEESFKRLKCVKLKAQGPSRPVRFIGA